MSEPAQSELVKRATELLNLWRAIDIAANEGDIVAFKTACAALADAANRESR